MNGKEIFLRAILCLLVVLPATFGTTAFGATLSVPSDDYPTIQAAIDVAVDGDEILVADGTYKGPGNVKIAINRKVTIRSQNGPSLCIIDCEGNGRAVTFTGAATKGAVLSGFTIKGGNGVDRGGAILCQNGANPTIENCIITENTAKVTVITGTRVTDMGYGGGIACYYSSPVISKCRIEANSAVSGGGGLFCIGSSPVIKSCTITKNNGGRYGGGVCMVSNSSPSISSCMVTANSATLYGGGIYCLTSSPSIINCTIAHNSTSDTDESEGGGFYLSSGSQATITNSILWENVAFEGPEIGVKDGCILRVNYSNVKGGKDNVLVDAQQTATSSTSAISTTSASTLEWSDDSNIDIDPKFAGEDDYHLAPDSPCMNAGLGDVTLVSLSEWDFEGDPRVIDAIPEMGGDECEFPSVEYEVQISVRPGSRDNKINLGAWGFLPVAVLSTPDFDATSIDPSTVEFAGAEPLHWVRTRVNRDRKADMLFFFWIRHLEFDPAGIDTETGTVEVTLTGESGDKGSIRGTDIVAIIKPKHPWHWWSKFEQVSHKKGHGNSK